MQDHLAFDVSSDIVDRLAALFPDIATELGVAGNDDRWTDLSPDGAAGALEEIRRLRRRVDALPEPVSDWDRLASEVAKTTLDEEAAHFEHEDHLRNLNSLASPLQVLREVWDHMAKETGADWENIMLRMERLPAVLHGYQATLDSGRRRGMVVALRQVRAAVGQCRVTASGNSRLARLTDEFRASDPGPVLVRRLEAAVARVREAFGQFADYLADKYAPDAAESDGVGEDRYVRAAYEFLGSTIDPVATYEWGWDEVADLAAQMRSAADRISPGASVVDALHVLKTDPDRTVADQATFREFTQVRLDDALRRLSGVHFDVPVPIRTVEVKVAPPGGSLGAYYVGPSEDFTRPGSVWWSLTPQGPYPVYDAVSTAYHEGFPGHHLQVGVQVSLAEKLSRLHRLWVWKSGSGEGWALYAERLMSELGFFEEPGYLFGWLSGQMLRACRIVIDIGSHLDLPIPAGQGFHPGERWTFATAVEMLVEYATLDRSYAESEVTRYLGWPGQAISYKVGEKVILGLRDEVKARRGAGFDPKQFHARLLEVGPVGLDLLRSELLC